MFSPFSNVRLPGAVAPIAPSPSAIDATVATAHSIWDNAFNAGLAYGSPAAYAPAASGTGGAAIPTTPTGVLIIPQISPEKNWGDVIHNIAFRAGVNVAQGLLALNGIGSVALISGAYGGSGGGR